MKRRSLAAMALILFSVQACGKEATGQVAAVVNGDEITLQEINAETGSTRIPDGVDKKVVQQAALQRIIERRLLAQAAETDGLGKTPEYLLRERQLRDALLVQLMGQKTERSQKVPDQQEIDKFIAENPVMFSNRKIFAVDRIQFPLPADPSKLQALKDDHSMAAVASRLQQLGIEFQRDATQLDSAKLGEQRLQQIKALPTGEPFVLAENGMAMVGVITGERTAPLTGGEARPLAVQAIQSQQFDNAMQQRLKQAKADAEISYQDGFSPPAAQGAATTVAVKQAK